MKEGNNLDYFDHVVVLMLAFFIVSYLYYGIKDSYSDIESAVQKSKLINDINDIKDKKCYQKDKAAFLFAKDEKNDFKGVFLKKGLLGWEVKSRYNFDGIEFSGTIDPITILKVDLGKFVLILCRYSIDHLERIKVNNIEIERFEIKEFNKAFGFILEQKKKHCLVQGINKTGLVIYNKELDKDYVKF